MTFETSDACIGIVPQIVIRDRNFTVNGKTFSLARRPLARKMLLALQAAKWHSLTKDELIDIIYDGFNPGEKSERFRNILRLNINKLASRTRLELNKCFNQRMKWIEFLVYDSAIDGFSLYRLKMEFVAKQQARLLKNSA